MQQVCDDDAASLCYLAAALRYSARAQWSEGVRSHFSVQLPQSGDIAVQNELVDWSLASPACLVKYAPPLLTPPPGVSTSAFHVHTALHTQLGSRARCVLHVHSPWATALACTMPGELEMVHQNCAYFYQQVVYLDYPSTGTETTQHTVDALLHVLQGKGNNNNARVVVHRNHGVTVIGESVPAAFDDLYYFESACRIYLQARATNCALRLLPAATCQAIASMRQQDRDRYGRLHLDAVLQTEQHKRNRTITSSSL